MPLTAWLHIAADDAVPLHKQGDVVCVRLAGAPVSERERKEFVIVEDWRDDKLEAELTARHKAGEQFPCIDYPYGARTADGELVAVSLKKVDLQALPDKNDLLDRTKRTDAKRFEQLTVTERTKPRDSKTREELQVRK